VRSSTAASRTVSSASRSRRGGGGERVCHAVLHGQSRVGLGCIEADPPTGAADRLPRGRRAVPDDLGNVLEGDGPTGRGGRTPGVRPGQRLQHHQQRPARPCRPAPPPPPDRLAPRTPPGVPAARCQRVLLAGPARPQQVQADAAAPSTPGRRRRRRPGCPVGWGSTSPFGGTAVGIALRWDGTRGRTLAYGPFSRMSTSSSGLRAMSGTVAPSAG